MDAPLNLAPKKGPSVWAEPRRLPENWRLATIIGGAVLTGYAWSQRTNGQRWLAGVGVGTLVIGLLGDRVSAALMELRCRLASSDDRDAIDETLEDTFPASDPPSLGFPRSVNS